MIKGIELFVFISSGHCHGWKLSQDAAMVTPVNWSTHFTGRGGYTIKTSLVKQQSCKPTRELYEHSVKASDWHVLLQNQNLYKISGSKELRSHWFISVGHTWLITKQQTSMFLVHTSHPVFGLSWGQDHWCFQWLAPPRAGASQCLSQLSPKARLFSHFHWGWTAASPHTPDAKIN